MAGTLIFLLIPLLVTALCFIMHREHGSAVFCVLCTAVIFFVTGFGTGGEEFDKISVVYTVLPSTPYSVIPNYSGSPGLMWVMKLCSVFNSDPKSFFLVVMLLLALLLGWFFLEKCSKPYAAVALFTLCFLIYRFVGTGFYIAALLCIFAFGYFRERRFFRFSGIVLLASCFDISAVFLIPLYFILQIPAALVGAAICALIAILPVIFPELANLIFGLVSETRTVSFELPLFIAAVYLIFAVLFIAASPMFANRGRNFGQLTVVMFAGAVFSLASVFDGRFFPLSAFLFIPSALVLAPEAYEIGKTFLGLVFPKEKKTARRAGFILCMLLLYGCCVYATLSGSFDISRFGSAFFRE